MGKWGADSLSAPLAGVIAAILANMEEVKKMNSGAKILNS